MSDIQKYEFVSGSMRNIATGDLTLAMEHEDGDPEIWCKYLDHETDMRELGNEMGAELAASLKEIKELERLVDLADTIIPTCRVDPVMMMDKKAEDRWKALYNEWMNRE